MYEDLGRADRMLERVCDFLRAALRLPESPMVPAATELALARQYLEIMKARLEERLTFELSAISTPKWREYRPCYFSRSSRTQSSMGRIRHPDNSISASAFSGPVGS